MPCMSVSAHRFARSSLGTSHEIPSGRYDGNAMLLNGSRFHVSCLGNISVKSLTKLCFFKGLVGSKTKSHYEIPREIKPIYRRKKKKPITMRQREKKVRSLLTMIALGGSLPLTSTSMSSYLSKLMPVAYWEKMESTSSGGGGGTQLTLGPTGQIVFFRFSSDEHLRVSEIIMG